MSVIKVIDSVIYWTCHRR